MGMPNKTLPTLPEAALKLLSVLADDNWSIHKLAETIRIDPSLTSKMIRAANAAQRGGDRAIDDLGRAAILLGKRKVSTLALTFSLSPVIARDKRLANYYQEYWLESAVQAVSAEWLAGMYHLEDEARVFTAGLLQDLGRLYFLQIHGDDYTRQIETAKLGEQSLVELEREAFGVAHPELGAHMLATWNFPERISAAIAVHHERHVATSGEPALPTLESVLRIASLVGEFFCGPHRGLTLLMLDEALSQFAAPRIATDELADQVCQRLTELADAFRLDVKAIPHSNAMLTESLQQIASMAGSPEGSAAPVPEHAPANGSEHVFHARLQELVRQFRIDPSTGTLASRPALEPADSQLAAALR
jgi:HD-like signal output (HDOD) protein